MTSELPPGRVGNLTPEQEEKLRQLWTAIFKVYHYNLGGDALGDAANGAEAADDDDAGEAGVPESVSSAAVGDKKKEKKRKRDIFKRSKKDTSASADESIAPVTKAVSTVDLAATSEDDKYGQSKLFQEALANQSPESIRNTIWSMVKHDHPDALVLRFLRARKWDVDKALVMLVSTMHWRAHDMHVDDDIMAKGEGGAAEEVAGSTDEKAKALSEDFLAQMRMGKSFLHGADKQGRPICIVRVRLHHQGDQLEESVERCTVYTIETARMALHPPVDTATIIFDMTGFSLANMPNYAFPEILLIREQDYSPVKFMIKCFEANYPECLGTVLVHKAPWLFQGTNIFILPFQSARTGADSRQGIWRIIRGWLDPVVASKVHFTNNVKDMEEFISKDQIIKELDGDEDWDYKYIEPEAGENDKMKDTATRDKLLTDRQQLYRAFEEATAQWVLNSDDGQVKALRQRREDVAKQLREHYWTLDPYIRARSLYDRTGMLRPDGTVDFYAKINKDEVTQTNGNAVAQSDVD
ncbi:phosphatidylinositol transfer protein csr1 [Sporothrix epigloea]|uniref:Phosphatidylinositol transfer protein csr1 n=1 Tax=Sporothrix epigloea TaxID=1892477 RepID=A0ABP0DYQ4_9PEZI